MFENILCQLVLGSLQLAEKGLRPLWLGEFIKVEACPVDQTE